MTPETKKAIDRAMLREDAALVGVPRLLKHISRCDIQERTQLRALLKRVETSQSDLQKLVFGMLIMVEGAAPSQSKRLHRLWRIYLASGRDDIGNRVSDICSRINKRYGNNSNQTFTLELTSKRIPKNIKKPVIQGHSA